MCRAYGIGDPDHNWYGDHTNRDRYERPSEHAGVVRMNRRSADRVVGLLIAAVLIGGGVLTWQTYQRNRALDEMMGGMMDGSMGGVHGTDPLWYVLGTLLAAVVIAGLYVGAIRDDLGSRGETPEHDEPPGQLDSDSDEREEKSDTRGESIDPSTQPRRRVLDLLPEDERRILEPVIESPGITQVALRDRSAFSKSKVSQTVSALEKRGLLYRERQGRTYRIYPSDELSTSHQ